MQPVGGRLGGRHRSAQRAGTGYRKSAGIGTLASFTIPIAAVVWVVWIAFFVAWYLLGIPFGIS